MSTCQHSQNAIGNPWGQLFRPLVHPLVRNTDSFRSERNRSPEQLDGLRFKHAELNHSSLLTATMVFNPADMVATMVDFADRLQQAMAEHQPPMRIAELARELGVSYTAIKKLLEGESKSFSSSNGLKAAAILKVRPDWLLRGVGEMRGSTHGDETAPDIRYLATMLAMKLKPFNENVRKAAASALSSLALAPEDSERYVESLASLLGEYLQNEPSQDSAVRKAQ